VIVPPERTVSTFETLGPEFTPITRCPEQNKSLKRFISRYIATHRVQRARWRGAFLPRRILPLLMLEALSKGPSHGYDLIGRTSERFNGIYTPSPGVVYPALQKLMIEKCISIAGEEDGKKVYKITKKGMKTLEERKKILEWFDASLSDPNWKAKAKLLRSMGRTMHMIGFSLKDLTPTQVAEIAKIVAEYNRKLELALEGAQ